MIFLTADEVIRLTGRQHRPAQAKALRAMGIEHRIRPDSEVIILRKYIENLLDGDSVKRRIKTVEPDWSVLSAKAAKVRK